MLRRWGVWQQPLGRFRGDAARRYLIIHADDAGMSHSVNTATIESLENGIVSSCSIMVPCPWFPEFALYAREHPQFDYGVHLTLNSEYTGYRWGPVACRGEVPSLLDGDGYFWQNVDLLVNHAAAAEVEIELRAQVERAKAFGIPITHLDSHMFALVHRADLLAVYVQLGLHYNLPVLLMRDFQTEGAKEYPLLADSGPPLIEQLESGNLPVVDRVAQFYGGDTHWKRHQTYLNHFVKLQPGVTELIVHCGFDDDELRAITASSTLRDSDRRTFRSREMRDECDRLGIEVVSWREVRNLTRR